MTEPPQPPTQQKIYGPPPDPVTKGNNQGLEVWCAVANTYWGKIPGKAKPGGDCWYGYDHQEHKTRDFKWIESLTPLRRVWNTGSTPSGAMAVGNQTDGVYYAAIADSEFGTVPGKAKGGLCNFSNAGNEFSTDRFHWICQ